jgi:hypothetical protein
MQVHIRISSSSLTEKTGKTPNKDRFLFVLGAQKSWHFYIRPETTTNTLRTNNRPPVIQPTATTGGVKMH